MSDVVSVPMRPNRTYAHRTATLIQVATRPRWIAVLEIREAASPTGKPKTSRYAVVREASGPGEQVLRLTKARGGESYLVCLPADQRDYPLCECRGFETNNWCKHVEALRALQAGGHLEDPEESF